jgi:hypothetical protein
MGSLQYENQRNLRLQASVLKIVWIFDFNHNSKG